MNSGYIHIHIYMFLKRLLGVAFLKTMFLFVYISPNRLPGEARQPKGLGCFGKLRSNVKYLASVDRIAAILRPEVIVLFYNKIVRTNKHQTECKESTYDL